MAALEQRIIELERKERLNSKELFRLREDSMEHSRHNDSLSEKILRFEREHELARKELKTKEVSGLTQTDTSENYPVTVLAKNEQLKVNITKMSKQMDEIKVENEQLKDQLKKLTRKCSSNTKENEQLKVKVTKISKQVDERKVEGDSRWMNTCDEMSRLENLQKVFARVTVEGQKKGIEMQHLQTDIAAIKQDMAVVQQLKKDVSGMKQNMAVVQQLKKDVSGMKQNMAVVQQLKKDVSGMKQNMAVVQQLKNDVASTKQSVSDVKVGMFVAQQLKTDIAGIKLDIIDMQQLKKDVADMKQNMAVVQQLKKDVADMKQNMAVVQQLKADIVSIKKERGIKEESTFMASILPSQSLVNDERILMGFCHRVLRYSPHFNLHGCRYVSSLTGLYAVSLDIRQEGDGMLRVKVWKVWADRTDSKNLVMEVTTNGDGDVHYSSTVSNLDKGWELYVDIERLHGQAAVSCCHFCGYLVCPW